ncbi:hypothetical protein Micbo1qcDRAFT_155247 [Microdochium bolleyi]|uniref:Uncharacterized protein n=1 Tax=Microdochium bolleyi TaxID=196109 RepID=A0A136JHM6_9PEZI|nr:hypothetical protein Micbo1qcDRAFT_155247 [Microdochium bolleyi]
MVLTHDVWSCAAHCFCCFCFVAIIVCYGLLRRLSSCRDMVQLTNRRSPASHPMKPT